MNNTKHWQAGHAQAWRSFRATLARELEAHVKLGRNPTPTPSDCDYFRDRLARQGKIFAERLTFDPSFVAYLVGMDERDPIFGRTGVVVLALAEMDAHKDTLPVDLREPAGWQA